VGVATIGSRLVISAAWRGFMARDLIRPKVRTGRGGHGGMRLLLTHEAPWKTIGLLDAERSAISLLTGRGPA
jgi:hypothetical protein